MNYDDKDGDILYKWKKPTCLKSMIAMISHRRVNVSFWRIIIDGI